MPLEPDPQEEPTSDDLDFYYGLNRRSAKRQDAPISGFGLGAIIGGVLILPLSLVVVLMTGSWILGLLLIVAWPPLMLGGSLLGGLTLTSAIEYLQQWFTFKNK